MRDLTLDSLGRLKQLKWEEKEKAKKEHRETREQVSHAYAAMKDARNDLTEKMQIMNCEFEILKEQKVTNDAIWKKYKENRDEIDARIQPLKLEADQEHSAMIDCFERANKMYDDGDREMATVISREGHEHRAKRDALNQEIRKLVDEIKAAKAEAKASTQPVDDADFVTARNRFEKAKKTLAQAEAEFNRVKEIRREKRDTWQLAENEFRKVKTDFERRLEEVRGTQREKQYESFFY